MSGFEAHMDKTLFANLKLSDGREAQARELLDDKIHRLGGAAPSEGARLTEGELMDASLRESVLGLR